MVAFHWWDRKPVHYLCTGSAMTESSIARHIKRVGSTEVPCPAAVNDYQRWMGGVDIHDQLRLQKFSLQMSTKFKKYYKSLFLGFVDIALVNAYLSYKHWTKITGGGAMKRGEWFGVLQKQLLQLKADDFTGVVATPPPPGRKRRHLRLTHVPEQSEDWVTVSGVQKRRQRSCKVCALLRTEKKKSFATTYFCERCSIDDAKLWLCNKIRREYKGMSKTCFDIWHDDFDSGLSIPPTLGKRVVLRRPGKDAGKRKRTRRELQLAGDEGDKEGGESGSDDEWEMPEDPQYHSNVVSYDILLRVPLLTPVMAGVHGDMAAAASPAPDGLRGSSQAQENGAADDVELAMGLLAAGDEDEDEDDEDFEIDEMDAEDDEEEEHDDDEEEEEEEEDVADDASVFDKGDNNDEEGDDDSADGSDGDDDDDEEEEEEEEEDGDGEMQAVEIEGIGGSGEDDSDRIGVSLGLFEGLQSSMSLASTAELPPSAATAIPAADTIAHRTRTKFSLANVPIDELESLLPPEPTDAEDRAHEEEYQRFLSSLLPTVDDGDNLSFLDEEDEEYHPDEDEDEDDEEDDGEAENHDTTGNTQSQQEVKIV
ncbi:hypothetical protein ATCC90586_003203 [Pythium insidiosum]|nr:hypothetical protein ATCC90586_003203 [Pythium insidiosum]